MLKHNICGDQPEVPNGMPDSFDPLPLKFFVNRRCPSVPTATEAIIAEVDQSEVAVRVEKPKRSAPIRDFDGTS